MADPTAPTQQPISVNVHFDANGHLNVDSSTGVDVQTAYLLLAAGQELLMRQFVPPAASQAPRIVIPRVAGANLPDGARP